MKILVVGASGATGKLLVEQLLNRGQSVSIIVRTTSALPESILKHENITIIQASILQLSDAEMAKHIKECHAVAHAWDTL